MNAHCAPWLYWERHSARLLLEAAESVGRAHTEYGGRTPQGAEPPHPEPVML
jgi:hypothetical protein